MTVTSKTQTGKVARGVRTREGFEMCRSILDRMRLIEYEQRIVADTGEVRATLVQAVCSVCAAVPLWIAVAYVTGFPAGLVVGMLTYASVWFISGRASG